MISDTFGAVVNVKPSTAVSYPAIWLLVKNGPTSAYKGALHLDRNQAIALQVELKRFINESSKFSDE